MSAVRESIQAMVAEKRALRPDEACAAIKEVMAGEATQAQIGAFLVALQVNPPALAPAGSPSLTPMSFLAFFALFALSSLSHSFSLSLSLALAVAGASARPGAR